MYCFIVTQSHRFLEGVFLIHVLDSPTTRPYRCDLSFQITQVALNAALAGASYLDPNGRLSYFAFKELDMTCRTPRVHAEPVWASMGRVDFHT